MELFARENAQHIEGDEVANMLVSLTRESAQVMDTCARENNPKNEKIPRKTLYCIVQPIDGTFGGDQQTREYSVIEIAKTAVQYMLDHGRIEFDLPQATKEKLKRSNRHPLRGIMKTKQQPIRLQGACEEHKRKHQKCTEDCVKRNKKTRTDEEDNMIINSTTS